MLLASNGAVPESARKVSKQRAKAVTSEEDAPW